MADRSDITTISPDNSDWSDKSGHILYRCYTEKPLWIDYVSYCAGMPLYVKRVYPQPKHFDAILNAVEAFENKVREIVATYRHNITNLHPTERILDNLEIRVA